MFAECNDGERYTITFSTDAATFRRICQISSLTNEYFESAIASSIHCYLDLLKMGTNRNVDEIGGYYDSPRRNQ